MPNRPRHPKSDLEAVLKEAEKKGWRVEKGRRYYKMYCPCETKHLKTVKLTPSDRNYLTNLLGQLKRATCWEKEE
ncbi:hypothetical protein [Actinoallomurus soli]|uniref:hypothetical protein n=1 Tax=Actinoallomurus soli TaxID=2952535 RepID=UPI0020936E4D|nr:hypothetical protein [Actinoallomurus soli]MCO5971728.1 hypothetical protein [Actinoallomurus soli]